MFLLATRIDSFPLVFTPLVRLPLGYPPPLIGQNPPPFPHLSLLPHSTPLVLHHHHHLRHWTPPPPPARHPFLSPLLFQAGAEEGFSLHAAFVKYLLLVFKR